MPLREASTEHRVVAETASAIKAFSLRPVTPLWSWPCSVDGCPLQVVGDDAVVALFARPLLTLLDAATGLRRWEKTTSCDQHGRLATGYGIVALACGGTLEVYDLASGSLRWSMIPKTAIDSTIDAVAVGERYVAFRGRDSEVHVLDIEDGRERSHISGLPRWLRLRGDVLFVASSDVAAYDVLSGKQTWRHAFISGPVPSAEPLLTEHFLYAPVGDRMVALDTTSGRPAFDAAIGNVGGIVKGKGPDSAIASVGNEVLTFAPGPPAAAVRVRVHGHVYGVGPLANMGLLVGDTKLVTDANGAFDVTVVATTTLRVVSYGGGMYAPTSVDVAITDQRTDYEVDLHANPVR